MPAKLTKNAATFADQLCDVYRWAIIDVDEAITNREHQRCVECKEPVRARKAQTNGKVARFEHVTRNPTCSLSGA